jgi:hypothetical protein
VDRHTVRRFLNPNVVDCRKFCAHTESLRCGPGSLCQHGCQKMLASTICPAELSRFFECAEKEPVEHWECNAQTPALKNGFCDETQSDFVKCLRSAAARK